MNQETATALIIILFAFIGVYGLSMIFGSRKQGSTYKPSPGTRVLIEDEEEDVVPKFHQKLGPTVTESIVPKTTIPLTHQKTQTGQAGVVGGKRKYVKKKNQGKVVPLNKDAQDFVKGKTALKAGDKINGKTVTHEYDQEILAMSKGVSNNQSSTWLPPDATDDIAYVNRFDTTPAVTDHSVNFGDGDFGGGGAGDSYTAQEVAAATDTSTD